jgi:hypothetical protein
MGGIGGTGGGGPLLEWTATDPKDDGTDDGAYTLPAGLSFKSDNDNRTVQNSASTIRTGFAKHAARGRNVGTGWGLSIESARTNQLKSSNDVKGAGWTASGFTVTSGVADPANGTTAQSIQSTGGTYVQQVTIATAPNFEYQQAVWARQNQGGGDGKIQFAGGLSYWTQTPETSWKRFTQTDKSSGYAVIALNPKAGADKPIELAFWQVELGKYPSSYIPTSAAAVTRSAELLSATDVSKVVPQGRFKAKLIVRPNYASGEEQGDHDILFINASNRAFLRAVDHKLVLNIGAANVATQTLAWDRDAALTIDVESTSAGMLVAVAGAKSGNGMATAGAAAAIDTSGVTTIPILGNASGSQECADLVYLAFFPAN